MIKDINKIKKNFPNIIIECYEKITSGHDNNILILNDKLVFRIPKENENITVELETEMNLLDILSKYITLNIPKYTYRTQDSSFGGYAIIKGDMLKKSKWRKLNKKIQETIIKDMAMFLEELHVQDIGQFGSIGFDDVSHHWFDEKYQKDVKKIIDEKYGKVFKKDTLSKIYTFFSNLRRFDMKYKSLTHFDLNPKNIIYSDDTKTLAGIIDFADACIFDPAVDFAKLLQHYGPNFTKKVLKYYSLDFGDIYERAVFYRKINFIFGLRYHYKRYSNRLDKLEAKVLKMLE